MKNQFLATRQLTASALGAALISICSWISVPAAVPFTMQTFGIFLVTGLLGLKCGFLSVLVYLLLGAVGIPVFAGFQSGIGYLFGMTGGYLVGFLFTALAVGLTVKCFGRRVPVLVAGMVLGLALCYAFGSLWFMKVYLSAKGPITVLAVLQMCVFPFLIPDGIKIALAIILIKLLHKQLPQSFLS